SWEGIKVSANNPSAGLGIKGIVELSGSQGNPIIIENAEEGIMMGDFYNVERNYWNSFNGEVYANHVLFRNNLRDISFMPTKASLAAGMPPMNIINGSYFNRCFFEKNEIFKSGLTRGGAITMWDTHGIVFENCQWDFSTLDYKDQSVTAAINTIDASFKITGEIEGGVAQSRFKGCHFGIFAQKTWA